ncbi:MAG: hypothetical protein WKF57_01365 [Nakamurella sp.]
MAQQDAPGADDPINYAEPHPLGVTHSNRPAVASGAYDGATNLLLKAVGSLRASDTEQAMTWIRRALAISFNDPERSRPAVVVAHTLVLGELADLLLATPEDDQRWIAAVRGTVARCDGDGLVDLQILLGIVLDDHDLSPAQQRAVSRMCEVRSDGVPIAELDPDSSELANRIKGLLQVGLVFVEESERDG